MTTETVDSETLCTCANRAWDPRHPFSHRDDCPLSGGDCRACGKPLLKTNRTMADGCPCNSARGVNHGLVSVDTCTCSDCDPAQTGSSRARALPTQAHIQATIRSLADAIPDAPLLTRLDQEAAFARNDEWLRDLLREAAERIRELEARR